MLSFTSAFVLSAGTPQAATLPQSECQSLADKLDRSLISKVEAATVEANDDMPAYCRAKGTIKPSIGFEMRLPLSGWNGNFYQAGCGGYRGQLRLKTPGYANGIVESVKRGCASSHTDSGDRGATQSDPAWAVGDRQAVERDAHRWVPLAHAAGASITKRFYGHDIKYRYLVGCTNGGRIGLKAARHYPTLFDGIIVGCAAVELTQAGGAFGAWKLTTNRDATAPILAMNFVRKLPFLTKAMAAQCDGLDGKMLTGEAACTALNSRQKWNADISALGIAVSTYKALRKQPGKPVTWLAQAVPEWHVHYPRPPLATIFTGGHDGMTVQGGGNFYPNRDARAQVSTKCAPVRILNKKMPLIPTSFKGRRTIGLGQLRHLSLCSNITMINCRVVDCVYDEQVPLDAESNYTIIASKAKDRQRNATSECGLGWVGWPQGWDGVGDPDFSLLVIRNMLADHRFAGALQNALDDKNLPKMDVHLPTEKYVMPNVVKSLYPCWLEQKK